MSISGCPDATNCGPIAIVMVGNMCAVSAIEQATCAPIDCTTMSEITLLR